MFKRISIILAGFLLIFNIFAWQEVFALNSLHYLKVDFLDVGQGDSVFIETPLGHQILIDGGPNSKVLEKLSQRMPFWDRSIDLVILSHPESDHMQGLLDVLKGYKADYILWTGVKRDTPGYKIWENVLLNQKKMGSKILIAEYGQEIKLGDVKMQIIYPLEKIEGIDLEKSANDTCVVIRLVYGTDSFLFTGDISSSVERKIINSKEYIKSDILKISHHGSKYSTSEFFLNNVSALTAVISVGKNNYGHPTQEVLQRLEKFGIKVERTDQDGDINFVSDGNKIKLIE